MIADVGILMPRLEPQNYDRFNTRYSGLAQELGNRSMSVFFTESHDSFDVDDESFSDPFDQNKAILASTAHAGVVRDLTMTLERKPIYGTSINVVHSLDLNRFIADKRNLFERIPEVHPATVAIDGSQLQSVADMILAEQFILKPITGHLSRGISLYSREELKSAPIPAGDYLAQELLDTSIGIAEIGVEGVHNVRVLSIARQAIGAIIREGGSDEQMLRDDHYGKVFTIDQLPESMRAIVDKVHAAMIDIDGSDEGVIAIDLMRGVGADKQAVDVLCEVNRRPQRISAYDLRNNSNRDMAGIEWLSRQWDTHEAEMLARKASSHATMVR